MNSELAQTKQWQVASDFFKAHYSLNPSEIKALKGFGKLDKDIQEKILKLFINKNLKLTALEQPAHLFYAERQEQDLSGQSIGSYLLVSLIAHGGMSSVYRARKSDIKTQKDVAIKLIPTSLQTHETTQLFKKELETLAKLHHPNIITLHHGDISNNGTPYLVMTLIENACQIDHYFKQHNSSHTEIIRQFITICQVLDYAHKNGVIHQDIKPSNVMIDNHGHVLVLDFGVAALAEVIPEHQAYTLNYAAPEQILKGQIPNPAFDTYAIASLLIKCLSQAPDDQPHWQHSALDQLKIDNDLRMILKKGIAETVSQRYQHTNDMAMDLNLWLKNLPINEFKNNPFYRFKKFVKRHPTTSFFAALALASMATGLIFYQQQYHKALAESHKAQQVKKILIDSIDQNDPDVSKGNALTVRDMLDQMTISLIENPVTDQNLAQELMLTLGLALNKLGDYQAAESNLQQVLAIDPKNAEALLELAAMYVAQKQVVSAKKLIDQMSPNLSVAPIEQNIRYHILQAQIHTINSEFTAAEEAFKVAEQLASQSTSILTRIHTLSAHATGLLEMDQVDDAINKMTEALTLSDQILGQKHSSTLELKAKLAETYLSYSGDKVQRAIAIFTELIPQQKELLGASHPLVAKSLFLMATGQRSLNQLVPAHRHALEALGIATQQFGTEHIFTAKIMMALGAIELAENKTTEAIRYASQAVDIYQHHLGSEHPETLQYKTSYVAMLVKNDQHREALSILNDIHPIQTQKLGATHRGTLYVDIILSKTHVALGQLAEGVMAGERCLNNAQKSATKNIMEVYCALTLENAYFLNQQYQQSLALIESYQNDPLIASQPKASEQFSDHLKAINKHQIRPKSTN